MLNILVKNPPFAPTPVCSFKAVEEGLSVQIQRKDVYEMASPPQKAPSYKYFGRLCIQRNDSVIYLEISYTSASVAPESAIITKIYGLNEQDLNSFWEKLTRHRRTPLSHFLCCLPTCRKIADFIESLYVTSTDIDPILSEYKGRGKVLLPLPLGFPRFEPNHSAQNLGGSSPSDAL